MKNLNEFAALAALVVLIVAPLVLDAYFYWQDRKARE